MWHWEQGRLAYFQFDELRKIAKFAVHNDLRSATREALESAVGLPFLPKHYTPWRNYKRVFQLALIATSDPDGGASITEVGKLLADDGKITSDEYFHFITQATTDPSPALSSWTHNADVRYPLLFVLRFLLARATQGAFTTEIADIVSTYKHSGFRGNEGQTQFLRIISPTASLSDTITCPRQPSESIKVLAQISYLTAIKNKITVSLATEDAERMFDDLQPVGGDRLANAPDEITRTAKFYASAISGLDFSYSATVVSDPEEAGFVEGDRAKRTHLIIERNGNIRRDFFDKNPNASCDFCNKNTNQIYPWASQILDIHHLLPLCSGARTSTGRTSLQDLVANCPTCHRAVHRYYDKWLTENGRGDFVDANEARKIYGDAKQLQLHRKAVSTYGYSGCEAHTYKV
jgi:hypothetical protein